MNQRVLSSRQLDLFTRAVRIWYHNKRKKEELSPHADLALWPFPFELPERHENRWGQVSQDGSSLKEPKTLWTNICRFNGSCVRREFDSWWKTGYYIVRYGLNSKLLYRFAVEFSPVCMHIVLCGPGVVTWGDAKTKELSDQYITFSNFVKIQKKNMNPRKLERKMARMTGSFLLQTSILNK